MRVLVVDVGGTRVKVLATGEKAPREFASGPTLTAEQMVAGVRTAAAGWKYDAVSIGYPGPVLHGRPVAEPHNLGPGWVGFDYRTAFERPVKLVNDAAMQARGSYQGGKMLFLGLGTGLGSTLIVEGIVEPMELGHLPYRDGTFETYVGLRGLQEHGLTQWRRDVADAVRRLIAALEPEDVVLGGGNVHQLDELPPGCRVGDNANAFLGGFRLWEESQDGQIGSEDRGARGPRRAGCDGRLRDPRAEWRVEGPHRKAHPQRRQHRHRRLRPRARHGLRGPQALQRSRDGLQVRVERRRDRFRRGHPRPGPGGNALHRLVEDLHDAGDDDQRRERPPVAARGPRRRGQSGGQALRRRLHQRPEGVAVRDRHREHGRIPG